MHDCNEQWIISKLSLIGHLWFHQQYMRGPISPQVYHQNILNLCVFSHQSDRYTMLPWYSFSFPFSCYERGWASLFLWQFISIIHFEYLYGSVLEKAVAPYSSTLAWKIPWMEEPGRLQSMVSLSCTWLSDFTFTFRFHALEKEMATPSSVLAWRIPGMGEPGRLPSLGLHRVGHNWSDLAIAMGQYFESRSNKAWLTVVA